jgi:hypothetical protein
MPSVKMGPGISVRSHTADEYIYLEEISDGIAIYRCAAPTLLGEKDCLSKVLIGIFNIMITLKSISHSCLS